MSLRLLGAGLLLALVGAASAHAGFSVGELPGGDVSVHVLHREALELPARYRVVFIPGSGCSEMQPIADGYFRGLLHAEVLVLQKPGVQRAAAPCTSEFVRWDALSRWADAARIALQADRLSSSQLLSSRLPLILVGASEGAEILPSLMPHAANLRALVMISSSGLNPKLTLEMQAHRLDLDAVFRDIDAAVASGLDDDALYQGRTLKYWRDLWTWNVSGPLFASDIPVVQVWGSEDALVPASAYERFSEIALANNRHAGRLNRFCTRRLAGADHGLRMPDRDGVQWLWSQLEQWAREPGNDPCVVMLRAP